MEVVLPETHGSPLNRLLEGATCSALYLVWFSRLVPTRTKNNPSAAPQAMPLRARP